MGKTAKLAVPSRRYYVRGIQVLLELEELEQLWTHLVAMGNLEAMSEGARRQTVRKQAVVVKHLLEKIKKAKDYYNITSSSDALSSQRQSN